MTTFIERERSLENHYAHLALLAFLERAHHHKLLAYRIAEAVGMDDRDIELFATTIAERCAAEPDDGALRVYVASQLALFGYALTPVEIERLVEAAHAQATAEAPAQRSWFVFLAEQIVSLFAAPAPARIEGEARADAKA